MLNNREQAILLWLGVALLLLLWKSETRTALAGVIRAAAHLKMIVIPVAMLMYVALLCAAAAELNLWHTGLLENTTFWFIGAGLVLLFNVNRASEEHRFFRQAALATIKITVLLGFFVNQFVFSLPVEIILQPLFFILVAMSVVAASDRKYSAVKRLLDVVFVLIGLGILGYVARRVALDWNQLDLADSTLRLVLPVWLTLGVFPFIYVIALYSAYELAFMRINIAAQGTGIPWATRLAMFTSFHLRLTEVAAFSGSWPGRIASATSFRDVQRDIARFRQSRHDAVRAEQDARDRLQLYAGADGEDAGGRRLDQREFEETKQALRTLASAQMGWYRNRGGRYRTDLVEILESQFERAGLPAEHGIELHVSGDGQSWWAWRRTVSGWCFAIGSADPPPDQWLFDGPEPASAFPGKHAAWSQFGIDAKNW